MTPSAAELLSSGFRTLLLMFSATPKRSDIMWKAEPRFVPVTRFLGGSRDLSRDHYCSCSVSERTVLGSREVACSSGHRPSC